MRNFVETFPYSFECPHCEVGLDTSDDVDIDLDYAYSEGQAIRGLCPSCKKGITVSVRVSVEFEASKS